ncbi:MAG: T9SS type A sorting domain-containing protein, partial [FCB group bacterium]|nr:T9SS type A sorting domain-containing protein [FCB group bacterium]
TPFISVGTNIDVTADFTASISINMHTASADEQVWTWTTTESVSTVGGAGDVYMGGAMNLLYGITDVLYIDANTCAAADSANIIIAPNGFATTYFYSEFQIEEEVIPNLITIGDTASAALWQGFVDQNQQTKQEAIFVRNLSFDAGVEYQYEDVYEITNNLTYEVEVEVNTELATELGLTINGVGASGGSKINLGVTMGAGGGSSWTHTTTTGYILADDDIGDSFTIDVLRDQYYATPVFQAQSGFSSCPWEGGTVPRDGPVLNVTPYVQVDIPPDEAAVFNLSIGNDSQSDDDREYSVRVIQGSNPDGAVVAVNGVIIQSSLNFFVPAGEVLDAVMTVARGPEAYIYNDLMIQLVPPCEYEGWQAGWPLVLADTVSVSVEFQVPCSESHIAVPEDGWLVAGDFGSDSVWVTVDGYDRYDANLLRIDLQYRENTSVRDMTGYPGGGMLPTNDVSRIYPMLTVSDKGKGTDDLEPVRPQLELTDSTSISEPGSGERVGDWFTTASVPASGLVDDYVLLPFNISPAIIIDNAYQLRAVAVCDAGLVPGTSNIVSGIIDRSAPELLGNPAPVNGILGPDDDIAIIFNEDIQCGAINVGAGDITLTNTVTGNPIDFTYTCGGTTIVINPNVENTFIENQTLRASVGPVEDLYGNRSAEPVQWEFFVNRNPLAWVGNAINDVVIWVEDSYETTRTLMNVGGSNRSYEITNIPDWLTVFPTGGILPPGGAETITFVLNQEPGAGHYIQTVYAHGTMGDEPMPVDIRVLCHPPAWELSPMDYEYSMNIIALLSIDGVLSADTYDMVAVFVGNELRGVQGVQYVPELENIPNTHPYQVYLTVFSNQIDGEDLTFQVWDASACSLMGQVIENYTFTANDVLGTPTAPATISATNQIIQEFDFQPGWSWFSLNVTPPNTGINSILSSLSPAMDDQIKAQNTYSQYAGSYGWLGTLTSLTNQSMYMLHLTTIDTLVVTGYPVDLETESIPISNGWTWIGYMPQMSYNVNDALMSLTSFTGDLIKSSETFSMFLEGVGWLGNLNFMNPRFGYKLFAQNSGTLVYPLQGELLPRTEIENAPRLTDSNSQDWLVNPAAFQANMSVVAEVQIDGRTLEDPEMLLGAFDGTDCRGVAEPTFLPELNSSLFFLTLYGNSDDENLNLRIYSPLLDETFELANTITYQADGILGSPDLPILLSGTAESNVTLLPDDFSLSQNYPNPFNPETTIEYSLPVDVQVSLIVYNLHGEMVRTLVNEFQQAGFKAVTWHGEDQSGTAVPSGIYFYRLTAGNFSANHKLALVK